MIWTGISLVPGRPLPVTLGYWWQCPNIKVPAKQASKHKHFYAIVSVFWGLHRNLSTCQSKCDKKCMSFYLRGSLQIPKSSRYLTEVGVGSLLSLNEPTAWVWIPALPLVSCVTSGKLIAFSVLLSHWRNREINSTYSVELLCRFQS